MVREPNAGSRCHLSAVSLSSLIHGTCCSRFWTDSIKIAIIHTLLDELRFDGIARFMSKPRVIVIGGGAAGLMAAGNAALHSADVTILEKMDRPARKLRITGKGRCNLTNIAPLPDFIEHFGKNGRFLRDAFSQFFTTELVEFFEGLGVNLVTERGGRVFPESGDAKQITDVLVKWAHKSGAALQRRSPVTKLITEEDRVVGVLSSQELCADAVILATGGASYPATGSTGDGYRLAESLGHKIVPIKPALVPLETAGNVVSKLNKLNLRNVGVKLMLDGKKRAEDFGELTFIDSAVSGPTTLSLSGRAVDALNAGKKVSLSVDLKPALSDGKLEARILRDIDASGKKQFKLLLKGLLPSQLIPVCIDQTGIPTDTIAHQITSEQRKKLRLWLKDFRLDIIGHRPFSEAIITSGGVDIREIDPRTMESRIIKGLYIVGEVLDIDADTGGYNLQAAFSTGWLAGKSAARMR